MLINVECTNDFKQRNRKLNTNSGISMYIYMYTYLKTKSTAVEMYRIQDPDLDVCELPYEQLRIGFPWS